MESEIVYNELLFELTEVGAVKFELRGWRSRVF